MRKPNPSRIKVRKCKIYYNGGKVAERKIAGDGFLRFLCDYEADEEWKIERQDQVFDLMNEGMNAKRIAKKLNLPIPMVESDIDVIRKAQNENR